MSEEQNFSEASSVVAPPPVSPSDMENGENAAGSGSGSGLNKNRRRRRKRKNRPATAAATAPAAPGEGQVPSLEAAQEPASAPAPTRQGNNPQQNPAQQAGDGQGARRKKKKNKFRRAGEPGTGNPRPEPGNSLQGSHSGQNGMRRNRKQQQGGGGRGPRSFVGPMDHSYREANGNYADAPASTISLNGNGQRRGNHGRHFNEDRLPPELMNHYRPVAIPDDAPTHIYFFIEDLFFTAKIQEVARQQGVKVAFMKPDKDVVAHLAELHDHEHPSLIVFDLNNAAAKPLTLIPKLKAKLKKGTSILGFLSHLQGDLKAKAVEAGCHTVMPRSAFSQNLPNLLRRYGVEEGDEPNFNM